MLLFCAIFLAIALPLKESFADETTIKLLQTPDVTFYFFDRTYLKEYNLLTPDNLKGENFTKRSIFLCHGWTESRNKTWYEDLKNAILEKYDVNVVQVDYSKPAANRYPVAVFLSKSIGKMIAKFLIEIPELSLENMTIIGHSLGGQIAGFVGKEIFAKTGKKVGKIIALDPAGPLFTFHSENDRLSSNDADIVEVIHTDKLLGFYRFIGHIDFYVNPSENVQPGCEQLSLLQAAFCSHHVSYKLFTESIRYGGFFGTFCESTSKFELGACDGNAKLPLFFENANKTGSYYLKTHWFPFNRNDELVEYMHVDRAKEIFV